MKQVTINIPAIEQVEFKIECLREDTPVRGNAMASGNDEQDKEYEDEIIRQLENGNGWAWCTVKVTASWRGLEGTEYIGACSYQSEDDFKKDGYYTEMKLQAYQELIKELKSLAD